MPVTQLSDLQIVPIVFSDNMILRSLDLDAFVQSSVAIRDPELDAFLTASTGGRTINPRYIGPLPRTAANVSSDDPDASSTPNKIGSLLNTAVRQSLNGSWSSMDLNLSLAGADPIGAIEGQVAKWWVGERQDRVLASVQGIVADNIANDAGDMVLDITAESGADAYFNADAFIDTRLTMGDRMMELSVLAVHSVVYGTMQKLNLIEYVEDSDAKVRIPTYQGAMVIVDDGMPVIAGTPTKYHSYLFGPGSIALGQGRAKVPFEVDRTPAAGNGGGQETLYSREELIIHPQGWQFGLTTTPTVAQLKDASNWTRAWERKRCQIAALISLG